MKSGRAQIVTFRLGEDLFAADIGDVERVLRYAAPTPVPNVPEWVKGVIEYRSRVVPVIDLRERFGLPAPAIDGATRLMVLSADGEWVAAVVDAVLEVVALGAAQLAAPPALFRGLSAEFLRGILRRNERLVIVLEVSKLLATHERLSFDAGVLAGDSLGAISIGNGVADLGAEAAPAALPDAEPARVPDPAPLAGSPPVPREPTDPFFGALGGPEPVDGGPLRLVGTSEDAPRPDESILGAPGTPHDAAAARDGSDASATPSGSAESETSPDGNPAEERSDDEDERGGRGDG